MVSVVQDDVFIDHPRKIQKHTNQNFFSVLLKLYSWLQLLPYRFIWDKNDGSFYLKSTLAKKVMQLNLHIFGVRDLRFVFL